jgi:beta-lactamase superfamily II metal-dependent hydrolase
MRIVLALLLALGAAAALPAAKTLDIYFIDVEGGQATLLVSPSGQSMLVDTGFPGNAGRDATRIANVAKKAGVKKIDYLVITHHHTDHVGGVTQLAEKLPVANVVDHGDTVETGKNAEQLAAAYKEFFSSKKRITVKPGDTIPVKGLDIMVLAAHGQRIPAARPGAGGPNPLCASAQQQAEDKSDNAQSVGFLLKFGDFRFIDLGDLTWNKELELVCPNNLIGEVDVYLTTHHGMNTSGPEQIVHALKPRVAVMNNGARKAGSPSAWQIIRKSPGLEDLWQLHYAIAGGQDNNSPDSFIANPEERCEGHYLKLSANQDGSFTVLNTRNKYQKTYAKR